MTWQTHDEQPTGEEKTLMGIRRFVPAAMLTAALTLTACGTQQAATSTTPAATTPTSSQAASNAPATCRLGWYRLVNGYSTGVFHPGPAQALNQDEADAYQAALPPGVTADWINVTFYLGSRKVGNQTTTLNVPQTGGTWSDLLVPDEAEAAVPVTTDPTPRIENFPGASCQVVTWGNAQGSQG
jgi:hypothetical protein